MTLKKIQINMVTMQFNMVIIQKKKKRIESIPNQMRIENRFFISNQFQIKCESFFQIKSIPNQMRIEFFFVNQMGLEFFFFL